MNAVLADAQMRGAHLGGFCVRISRDGHSLQIRVADSEENRGGGTQPPNSDGDETEVVPLPTYL